MQNLNASQEHIRETGRVLEERTEQTAARQAEMEAVMERFASQRGQLAEELQKKNAEIEQMKTIMEKFESDKVAITNDLAEKTQHLAVVKTELERAASQAMEQSELRMAVWMARSTTKRHD